MQAHNSNPGNKDEREEERGKYKLFSPAVSSANRFITLIITLLQRNK